MLQTFQTTCKVLLGRGSILSDAAGVDGLTYLPSLPLLSLLDGLKPCLYLISSEIFDIISVGLLLCYKSSICTVRVSITDPGMTLVHGRSDCLRSGRYSA